MSKPDIIVTWPIHLDYPLFRYSMSRFKSYYGNLIIAFSDHNRGHDYSAFVREALPEAIYPLIPSISTGDWRNHAVNAAIGIATSESLLFLEQDFLMKDERVLEVVLTNFEYQFIYYDENGRKHPAFAYVKRELLEQSSKDFSANPPVYDHFGKVFREIATKTAHCSLEDLGLHASEDYYHMAGLSNNYDRYADGATYYKPNEFLTYNHYAQQLLVPHQPEFLETMRNIDEAGMFELSEADPTIERFFT